MMKTFLIDQMMICQSFESDFEILEMETSSLVTENVNAPFAGCMFGGSFANWTCNFHNRLDYIGPTGRILYSFHGSNRVSDILCYDLENPDSGILVDGSSLCCEMENTILNGT